MASEKDREALLPSGRVTFPAKVWLSCDIFPPEPSEHDQICSILGDKVITDLYHIKKQQQKLRNYTFCETITFLSERAISTIQIPKMCKFCKPRIPFLRINLRN